MGAREERTGVRRILPLLVLGAALVTSPCTAQVDSVVGEGGSASSEPLVVLSDGTGKVPLRQASQQIRESTDSLLKLVWDTRETTRTRLLSTKDHTPWQIMHGQLGLRQDFLITHEGRVVNSLEWIQSGPTFREKPWFQKTPYGGRAHPYVQPYWFEGHINQFLAILASCNVPLDAKFNTPDGPITMADMLKNAQMTANSREEVTWTLWALATYLPWDARWTNAAGEAWSIEKLVQLETAKPVGGPTSPCGGTHGLFALARARNVYLRSGKPLRGVWFEADQKIKKYIEVARLNRNPDGSLSSGWFKNRSQNPVFDKRMASQGHLLEFLMMAVSQQELRSEWVRRAVEATCNDLNANQKAYVECSPLFHAANALSIFIDRTAAEQQQLAASQPIRATDLSSTPKPPATAPAIKSPAAVSPPRRPAQLPATRPQGNNAAKSIAPPAPPASNLVLPPPKTQLNSPPPAPAEALNTPTPNPKPAQPPGTVASPPQRPSLPLSPPTQAIPRPASSSSTTRPTVGGPKPLPELKTRPADARYPEPPSASPSAATPGRDYRSQSATPGLSSPAAGAANKATKPASPPLITNPRGVPVKSISTGNSKPGITAPKNAVSPPAAPAPAAKKSTGTAPPTAASGVSKTAGSADEVIMLDDFLLGPADSSTPTPPANKPAEKPPAAPTPPASTGKRPLRGSDKNQG